MLGTKRVNFTTFIVMGEQFYPHTSDTAAYEQSLEQRIWEKEKQLVLECWTCK